MELATKQDFESLRSELVKLISTNITTTKIPAVIHSDKAKELLGGVSDGYLKELRLKKILKPTKVGGIWLYNLNEVVSLLPPDPETK